MLPVPCPQAVAGLVVLAPHGADWAALRRQLGEPDTLQKHMPSTTRTTAQQRDGKGAGGGGGDDNIGGTDGVEGDGDGPVAGPVQQQRHRSPLVPSPDAVSESAARCTFHLVVERPLVGSGDVDDSGADRVRGWGDHPGRNDGDGRVVAVQVVASTGGRGRSETLLLACRCGAPPPHSKGWGRFLDGLGVEVVTRKGRRRFQRALMCLTAWEFGGVAVSVDVPARYTNIFARAAAGAGDHDPVALDPAAVYERGWITFCGRRFSCSPAAMVPRPATESVSPHHAFGRLWFIFLLGGGGGGGGGITDPWRAELNIPRLACAWVLWL